MKKILLGIIFALVSVIGFSQNYMPTLSQFSNGEQMSSIRGKLNSNASNTTLYVNRVIDSLYSHNLRLIKLIDSLYAHNLRLIDIETDTAAYRAEGSGGEIYTFTGGLTKTTNTITLGGPLTGNTSLTTGNNEFRVRNLSSIPTTGDYNYLSVNGSIGSTLSALRYAGSAITSFSQLYLSPNNGYTLTSQDLTSGILTSIEAGKSNVSGIRLSYDVVLSGGYKNLTFGPSGLVYGADYSGDFTDRSLVDKYYVDNFATVNINTETLFKITTGTSDTGIYVNNTNEFSTGIRVKNSGGSGITVQNSSATGGIDIINTSTGEGVYITNSGLGSGEVILNTSTGQGSYIFNNVGGQGSYIENNGIGEGEVIVNNSTGDGESILNMSTGYGLAISNQSTGTGLRGVNYTTGSLFDLINSSSGTLISAKDETATEFFALRNDSTYITNQANGLVQWLGITSTGGVFADSIDNAGFALCMELPTLKEVLDDTIAGEIGWYVSPVEKIYSFKGQRQSKVIKALQASAEFDKRYILELQEENIEQKKDLEILENRVVLLEALVKQLIEKNNE